MIIFVNWLCNIARTNHRWSHLSVALKANEHCWWRFLISTWKTACIARVNGFHFYWNMVFPQVFVTLSYISSELHHIASPNRYHYLSNLILKIYTSIIEWDEKNRDFLPGSRKKCVNLRNHPRKFLSSHQTKLNRVSQQRKILFSEDFKWKLLETVFDSRQETRKNFIFSKWFKIS